MRSLCLVTVLLEYLVSMYIYCISTVYIGVSLTTNILNQPVSQVFCPFKLISYTRVKSGSGYLDRPGHVLSRSSRSHPYPLYKISSLTTFCIRICVFILVSGPDQSDELSMLDSENVIVSPDFPQDNKD